MSQPAAPGILPAVSSLLLLLLQLTAAQKAHPSRFKRQEILEQGLLEYGRHSVLNTRLSTPRTISRQGQADHRNEVQPLSLAPHASSDASRRLHTDSSNVTVVTTAEELLRAVVEGDPHIEMQSHLDLTSQEFMEEERSPFKFLLGSIPASVESIRGACQHDPPYTPPPGHAPLLPRRPGQCMVLVDGSVMLVEEGQLWLDNVYLRLTTKRDVDDTFATFVWVRSGALWGTGLTLQGNGDGIQDCKTCGIGTTRDGRSYVSDSIIASFEGWRVIDVGDGAAASYVNCTVSGNTMFHGEGGSGLMNAKLEPFTKVYLRLQGLTITNNTLGDLPTVFVDRGGSDLDAVVYSDDETLQVCVYEGGLQRNEAFESICDGPTNDTHLHDACYLPQPCAETNSLPLAESAVDDEFTSAEDGWFVQLQQILATGMPPSETGGDMKGAAVSQNKDSDRTTPYIILGAACVVVVLLATASFAVFRRSRKKHHPDLQFENVSGVDSSTINSHSQAYSRQSQRNTLVASRLPECGELQHDKTSLKTPKQEWMSPSTLGPSTAGVQSSMLVPLSTGATDDDRKSFLEKQLDSLRGQEVDGNLHFMEGAGSRARGGQGIVQFAVNKMTRQEVALKFFVAGAAFQAEVAQYTDSSNPLRKFLPQCLDIIEHDGARLADANGNALPPCIVMEKGESLDMWVQRNNRDMDQFTCMQIIHHVCECLTDLHEAGYVHRDLKPANILWLPSRNRWTLIDFGCAALVATRAHIGFTLAYVAPEAATAYYRRQERAMDVGPELDAWSVGVLAVELFNGKPALIPFIEGKEQVIAKLVGEDCLPWEGEGKAKELLKRAGRFKDAVLGLLHRNPCHRTRVQTFVQQYAAIMSTTTQQVQGLAPPLAVSGGSDAGGGGGPLHQLHAHSPSSGPSSTNVWGGSSGTCGQPTFDVGDRHVWSGERL